MRFSGEDNPTPILHAYLTNSLPAEATAMLQEEFHFTAGGQVRLAVHDNAEFYGQTPEQIRAALEARDPETGDFILIGDDAADSHAVWYVADWVTDEEYEENAVQRGEGRIVWRLRVMIKAAPSRWVDYSIANSSIQEDIESTTDTWPWDPTAPARPFGEEEFPHDPSQDQTAPWRPPAYVVAGPGEWEEGPGNLMDVDPPQERVYRLTRAVADQHGLRSEWAIAWKPTNEPEGSICLAQPFL